MSKMEDPVTTIKTQLEYKKRELRSLHSDKVAYREQIEVIKQRVRQKDQEIEGVKADIQELEEDLAFWGHVEAAVERVKCR